ncbi:TPA: phage portal protein, partial [Staphylococcus aureus]|nr:phage portal protein [Staphylococcus aureus]
ITFTPNLPKSLNESIEAFNSLNGGVSEQTRLKLLPIIDNPFEEIKKMEDEQNKVKKLVIIHHLRHHLATKMK